jgi:hypothetical protein
MHEPRKPTKREFLKWRSPVRGKKNPQSMDNPLWQWCILNPELSAYEVGQNFDGPDSFSNGPCWCFDRLGRATVNLPDGRIVHVGGEHEDHYDPDFYIYNDVVVVDDAEVQIFGYPESVFPPTDFHTATLVGSNIILIGNLGYPDDRIPGTTQVLKLDTETWQISKMETSGEAPGWIHRHEASWRRQENTIVVSGGLRYGDQILENFNDYKLCLESLIWTQLTDRKWSRWIFEREDGEANSLWDIRNSSTMSDLGVDLDDQLGKTLSDAGLPPDLYSEMATSWSDEQKAQIKKLYSSPFSDDLALEDEEEYGRYRLNVDGTTVRFDEDTYSVTVTVEGQLSAEASDAILTNLQNRLSAVEGVPYTIAKIDETN